jgi:hypothetical protein
MSLNSFGKFKKQYSKLHPHTNTNVILKKYTRSLRLLNFGIGVKKNRFYDDDPRNIEIVSQDPRIECILVQRRQMSDGTKGTEDTREYRLLLDKTIPTKTYNEHLTSTYNLHLNSSEHEDLVTYMNVLNQNNEKHVTEAFDPTMIAECRQWAQQLYNQEIQKNTQGQQQHFGNVFFDFDQVINTVEGISILDTAAAMKTQFNVDLSGIVKYLIGSPERLRLLRELFADLESKRIKIYILTNNTGCTKLSFSEVLHELYSGFNKSNILCCASVSGGKLECLYQNNIFIRYSLVSLQPFLNKLHEINQHFGEGLKRCRFYDDDPRNIRDVSEDVRIECILVQRRQMSDGTMGIRDPINNSEEYNYNPEIPRKSYFQHLQNEYSNFNGHNDLVKYIQALGGVNSYESHVSESLSIEQMEECKQWASNVFEHVTTTTSNSSDSPQGPYGHVFFDFDRVINCCEGYAAPETPQILFKTKGVVISGVLKYVVGSPTRLEKLRELFDYLETKNIHAYILTNNTGCTKQMFTDLLRFLHKSLTSDRILCCSNSPTKLICLQNRVELN